MNKNQTLKYLFVLFVDYGNNFLKYLQAIHKLGLYIGDGDYVKAFKRTSFEPLLFLHIVNNNLTDGFLQLCREQMNYETDYISKNNTHVIVFNIDKSVYLHFIKSEYSKMFPKQKIEYYFQKQESTKNILNKTDKTIFENEIFEKFNVEITINDNRELDFPIVLEDEILNYSDIYYNHYLNTIQ